MFALVPVIYPVLAAIFKVPSFKMSGYISLVKDLHKEKKNPFIFLSVLSKLLAKYAPVSVAKEVKLTRMLERAGIEETPKEYTDHTQDGDLIYRIKDLKTEFIFDKTLKTNVSFVLEYTFYFMSEPLFTSDFHISLESRYYIKGLV